MPLCPKVTTFTSMSVHDPVLGTLTITSKVTESTDSALAHVRAMNPGVEPVYVPSVGGCRWTWEFTGLNGVRCSDTVRIF
jgi:hypothetical protein